MSEKRLDPPCEYCGERHEVRALCAARTRISRRRFFTFTAKAIVGAAIAPSVVDVARALAAPIVEYAENTNAYGLVGGIERATFTFWRNRQVSGDYASREFDVLAEAMAADCPGELITIPTSPSQVEKYLGLQQIISEATPQKRVRRGRYGREGRG